MDQEDELIPSQQSHTNKYEVSPSNYKLESVNSHYLEGPRKAINGFKNKIDKFEAKAKLSQNHSKIRQKLVTE